LKKTRKLTKEAADEGKRLLSRMPTLKSLQDLAQRATRVWPTAKLTAKDSRPRADKLLDGMKLDEEAAKLLRQTAHFRLEKYKSAYIKETQSG